MSVMKLHYLDARGTLTDTQAWLHRCLRDTYKKAANLMRLKPLDVVVQTGKHVILEKGHLGYSPRPGVIFITVDPESAALKANADASFERMFAHELHHAARWDGPGYGSTLGEALVSEGLAGHFALELFGGNPEPWERLPQSIVRDHVPVAIRDWKNPDYNHDVWFFGVGDVPRWLGYSLGFRAVEKFLAEHPDRAASNLAGVQAAEFHSSLTSI